VVTGCIIPDVEYGPPRQSPVFVLETSIAPTTLTPLTIAPDAAVHLTLTAFAEDAGEELMSALYVDYKHNGGYFVLSHRHGSHALETPRQVEYTVKRPLPQSGCHTLTVMLFHESDWDDAKSEVIGVPADLASVNWLASFGADGTLVPLATCPDVSTEAPATGG
jgi:hypothetical protein